MTIRLGFTFLLLVIAYSSGYAQQPPYDVYPAAETPYYRVRYEASTQPGELSMPVKYTIWIPSGVDTLRGVIVHQHGCGEGSCKSGLTGAYDLHWQALAQKHRCALMAPSYEQPKELECILWCDPRNGSGQAFQNALTDLGQMSGHPELTKVPWALWGHSGGAVWVGTMTLLYPDQVAATWLRSGSPVLTPLPDHPSAKVIEIPSKAHNVPMMSNLGTEEGYTVKEGRFAKVWPAAQQFWKTVRSDGGLFGVAIDPLTGHQCGNQRYLAIPWFDACLSARLPQHYSQPLLNMPPDQGWLATIEGKAWPAAAFPGDDTEAIWLPGESVAKAWKVYMDNTEISDATPPPIPTNIQVSGQMIRWECDADLESGIAHFIILRDGEEIGTVPENPTNRFGRPLFQGLQYSDTPVQPLQKMEYYDSTATDGNSPTYQVIAVNTVGLQSN
ncbi:MAG: hypothetical protein HKN87_08535 [Saprospiraceae bacterium]|nr:hypothetical protein [Saprospiraceae bacterium]